MLRGKFMGSIPLPQSHALTDRESWRTLFKPRLDPDHPERWPADWDARVARWRDPARAVPAAVPGGSLYGWLRNWMGMEQVSYVLYDDPAWFGEMVETCADCIIGTLTRILETGATFEVRHVGRHGPQRGSAHQPHFKQYSVPQYRRITDLLHRYGVDVVWLDCDGNIDLLIPLWLDAASTACSRWRWAPGGQTRIKLRQQYGRDLLIMGGFDKHILAQGKAEIEAECAAGAAGGRGRGYIGFCDHRTARTCRTPTIPLPRLRAHHLGPRHQPQTTAIHLATII
ncbi:MAG: uroporphyrinogen decarboxylase family protein [Caldilineaceae bacterium]